MALYSHNQAFKRTPNHQKQTLKKKMMLQKPFVILMSCLWLFMAISSTAAQTPPRTTPVLDTAGRPLQRGVEYFIKPAITDVAGELTLQARNGTLCPLFVGFEQLSGMRGLPVTFAPFFDGENIIREGRDIKVVFEAASICVQPTQWVVGRTEVGGRRLVAAGSDDTATGFFRIDKSSVGIYNISWCPNDVPIRGRPRCGSAGLLEEQGVKLLALDGPAAFPFEFERSA